MSEQNLKAALAFYEDAFEGGRLDVIEDVFSADCVLDDPAMPDLKGGLENIRQMVIGYREAFPDLQFTITDQLVSGDAVILRWEVRGTHRGPLQGFAATNRTVHLPGIVIMRFANGKVTEAKVIWHALGMQQQLGLPGTAAQAHV